MSISIKFSAFSDLRRKPKMIPASYRTRFTPEAILEAARENLDTRTLSELYLELRALPWQEFEPTRQKFETIFADRVIEIIREEMSRASPSAGRINGTFFVEWHQTTRQAAASILNTLK
jgi:hypothetical protein